MKHFAFLLTLIALLAAPLAPAAFADEPGDTALTDTSRSTVAPLAPLALDPTQGALASADYMGCAEEDIVIEKFYQQPDPQVCVDYCTNNGWSYLSYDDLGRGIYLCFCCSA